MSRDRERRARFEREAKLLASLNHPAIATLYGFEDGFLVMELVEGETLAERIARGAIPVDEAIPLFVRVAEGLEAAHDKGVIHRDLKPANLMIGPDGLPKILDFGLAKAFSREEDVSAETSQSPMLTKGTALGVIMGTASYMSPEQARGKTLDKRTDVWAFGCCLYEALSGNKAFDGETVSDIIGAVIRAEPDWSALPAAGRALVKRCLVKDSRQRLRDIGDARIELGAARDEGPAPAVRRRAASLLFVTALMGVVVGAALFWVAVPSSTPASDSTSLMRATISLPEGQRQPRLMQAPLAISRDGKLLAYVARLNAFESRKLPGTEDADAPFFSPDGQWVGFFAAGKLKKVSVDRGSSLTIANASNPKGASWGDDDFIVFVRALSAGLWAFPRMEERLSSSPSPTSPRTASLTSGLSTFPMDAICCSRPGSRYRVAAHVFSI